MAISVFHYTTNPDADKRAQELYRIATKASSEYDSFCRGREGRRMTAHKRYLETVEREFVLKPEHFALLREMTFQVVENMDVASIAASGKYPFGNSDWENDVFRILKPFGWEPTWGPEGHDDETIGRVMRIMAELPHALNAILKAVTGSDEIEFLVRKATNPDVDNNRGT